MTTDRRKKKKVKDEEISDAVGRKGRLCMRRCGEIRKLTESLRRNWKPETVNRNEWKRMGKA